MGSSAPDPTAVIVDPAGDPQSPQGKLWRYEDLSEPERFALACIVSDAQAQSLPVDPGNAEFSAMVLALYATKGMPEAALQAHYQEGERSLTEKGILEVHARDEMNRPVVTFRPDRLVRTLKRGNGVRTLSGI